MYCSCKRNSKISCNNIHIQNSQLHAIKRFLLNHHDNLHRKPFLKDSLNQGKDKKLITENRYAYSNSNRVSKLNQSHVYTTNLIIPVPLTTSKRKFIKKFSFPVLFSHAKFTYYICYVAKLS